jgi:hypothetical protein
MVRHGAKCAYRTLRFRRIRQREALCQDFSRITQDDVSVQDVIEALLTFLTPSLLNVTIMHARQNLFRDTYTVIAAELLDVCNDTAGDFIHRSAVTHLVRANHSVAD